MSKKCKRRGCYDPANCVHGYCAHHCPKGHEIQEYGARTTPRSKAPHIGVEIECEFRCERELQEAIPLGGHHDGSLSVGAEFKICRPSTRIAADVRRLVKKLWERRARASTRCGLHVHIDARAVSTAKQQEFMKWCQYTQGIWFGLMPASRRDNSYCHTITGSHCDRHTWIHPTYYDTIECRIHPGSVNPFKVAAWVEVMIHLQRLLLDNQFHFEKMESAEETFWTVFASAPAAVREYLEARKNGEGILRDYCFEPITESEVA